MEKDFVPYELAVKLKAIGFDKECFGAYHNEDYLDLKSEEFDYSYAVKAPTFSQAFRWFREKYGLKHHIWAGKISTIFYGYNILNIDEQEFVVNNSAIGGGDCDFDTYEEAELACLTKLIEIVETRTK